MNVRGNTVKNGEELRLSRGSLHRKVLPAGVRELVDGFAEVPGPVPERVRANELAVPPPRGSGRRIGF